MVSLKFIFNEEKLKASGYTEDELLQPMREHAEKYNIKEEEKGYFSKDGDDALCVLSMFIPDIVDKNPEYIGIKGNFCITHGFLAHIHAPLNMHPTFFSIKPLIYILV